jgi:hypothetical protein
MSVNKGPEFGPSAKSNTPRHLVLPPGTFGIIRSAVPATRAGRNEQAEPPPMSLPVPVDQGRAAP